MGDEDPFECRLAFLSLLQRLNASEQSIYKAANYAIRHRNLSEDLFSCLKEELNKASINARLNMLYVLDAIFNLGQKAKFPGYLDLTRKELHSIVQSVIPSDNPKSVVNLQSTRKILKNWKQRQYFDAGVIDAIDSDLSNRSATSPSIDNKEAFSKQDILRRMEEDRVRHKRLREEMWSQSAEESSDAEFEQLWESTLPLDPNTDYEAMMKQNRLHFPHYAWQSLPAGSQVPASDMSPMAVDGT